jgi:hypothetical protein
MDPAQKRFMETNHPGMAHRWMQNANKSSESNESPQPGLKELPRVPEAKRDFGPLHPGAKQRLKTSGAASTQQSDEEDGVEAHHPRGGPEKMSLKSNHVLDPLGKRDVKVATRKRV